MGDFNVLKPDLAAPGLAIIAQATPSLGADEHAAIAAGTLVPQPAWESFQGTSMATPHVAGSALLLKQAHPDWGPAAIKSALMTTAYSTLPDYYDGMLAGQTPWGQARAISTPPGPATPA